MKSIFSNLLGVISALALLLHTLSIAPFLYCFILLRALPLGRAWRNTLNVPIVAICSYWMAGLLFWMEHVYRSNWQVKGFEPLDPQQWYLLTANHQSWVDILVLYKLYHGKIPFLKFFIKKELGYIPIVGQAWWALDFPFMQRHSQRYLRKHPHKIGDDLKATQQACEKFNHTPTSIMNFVEGTRLTKEKHKKQNSPFKYLLRPKTTSLAFTIQALGARFAALTSVSIHYEQGIPSFWDLLCGRVQQVNIRVRDIPIPPHFSQDSSKQTRHDIQKWIVNIWQENDAILEQMKRAA